MVYIGIDVGGTGLKAGVVDENGKILSKVSCPTGVERGHEAVIADMAQLALKPNTFYRRIKQRENRRKKDIRKAEKEIRTEMKEAARQSRHELDALKKQVKSEARELKKQDSD